jgi:hypothetical protein
LGAAAGLLGGALLMHEGEKVGEWSIYPYLFWFVLIVR